MVSQLPSYVDTDFDDDELMSTALALVSGDLGPALRLVAATRDQPHRRELVLDVLGGAGNVVLPQLLDLQEERPDDLELLLLLGSAQSVAGWQSRGAAGADQTAEEQWDGLRKFSHRAHETLHRAAALDPDDVAPWALMMSMAVALPTHRREAAEVYEEVVKRVPDLVNASFRRLHAACKKWYGSHEEMLGFARGTAGGAPDGHPLLALIPAAHIEMHVYLTWKTSFLVRMWQTIARSYLKKQRAEVDAASDRLLAGTDDHPRSLWAHQIFANYYFELFVTDRLALHLARGGERASRWPWGYSGDADAQFARAHSYVARFHRQDG
ncbi:hypothetical protein OG205_27500 [Lentzea sp. NBC_00516]|uniref:hypothetical protein n=1 Tax=Lentzea sp. NBC_00516 TaxID=2903582 RepID=UPI002E811A63|nr:hypothetical protein [Lentzea sp. NBC_00516]WUD21852.1 hypothetical protein OG205_27500 [Lentzea sp. NBC_00516]